MNRGDKIWRVKTITRLPGHVASTTNDLLASDGLGELGWPCMKRDGGASEGLEPVVLLAMKVQG